MFFSVNPLFCGLPNLISCFFFSAKACFVRWLISKASFSAMAEIMCIVKRFAVGISQQMKSTFAACNDVTKCKFLASLSNLATINVAVFSLQHCSASFNCGRLALFPVSTSIYSAMMLLEFFR